MLWVPCVLSRIQLILSVTLRARRSQHPGHVTVLTNESPPGVHPRVAVERAAVSPADHADQRVAAALLNHEGAAGVALARVLARVRGADVHPAHGITRQS